MMNLFITHIKKLRQKRVMMRIIKLICHHQGLPRRKVFSHSRRYLYCSTRQIIFYILRGRGYTCKSIGDIFEMNRGSVWCGSRVVIDQIEVDGAFNERVLDVVEYINKRVKKPNGKNHPVDIYL